MKFEINLGEQHSISSQHLHPAFLSNLFSFRKEKKKGFPLQSGASGRVSLLASLSTILKHKA